MKTELRTIVTCALTVAALAASTVGCHGAETVVVRVDPYTALFAEDDYPRATTDTATLVTGGSAMFQFAIRSDRAVSELSTSVVIDTPRNGRFFTVVRSGFVGYVSVTDSLPRPPADRLRSPSMRYPDPIYEFGSIDLDANRTQGVVVVVETLPMTEAGLYTAHFEVKGRTTEGWFRRSVPFSFRVEPVTLSAPSLVVSNWSYFNDRVLSYLQPDSLARLPYSSNYWRLIEDMAQKMRICRQSSVDISPIGHTVFDEQQGRYQFDFNNFDRLVDLFIGEGVATLIEGSPLGRRLGNWESNYGLRVPLRDNEGNMTVQLLPIDDKRTENFYSQFLPALTDHLARRGIASRYVQHLGDEPTDRNAASYVKVAKFVARYAPDLRIVEAVLTTRVEGAVDVWVPQLNFFERDSTFYFDRAGKGEELWYYTCMVPQGNYANRFVELPLYKSRLLPWIAFRYGATGLLHWGFNSWNGATEQQMGRTVLSEASGRIAESNSVMPAGDMWIVYPAEGRVHSSRRLEALRDGTEDYALLEMVARFDRAAADSLCHRVVESWTLYHPELLDKVRLELIELCKTDQNRHPKQVATRN